MNTETELLLIKGYQNGIKTAILAKEYHCSTNTISKIVDKYNIPRRAKIPNTNKDLSKFYDLSLPETQYWLGYICADGNVQYNTDSGMYVLSLFSIDIEVIDKFISYFGQENTGSSTRKQNGVHEVRICSKELCKYLVDDLNITPNKSLTLNPNIELTPNFILGYFDGDGCIVSSSNTRTRYECNFTCGNREFLERVKEVLDKENIYSIIYTHTDSNGFKIRIDRKAESEKLYRYMYTNMVVCLSRKLNKFVALYGNI